MMIGESDLRGYGFCDFSNFDYIIKHQVSACFILIQQTSFYMFLGFSINSNAFHKILTSCPFHFKTDLLYTPFHSITQLCLLKLI